MTIREAEYALTKVSTDNFLRKQTFVIVDFETLTPKGRSPVPIELGALKISDLKVDRNYKIQTGITNYDVEKACSAETVFEKFDTFLNIDESYILVAQNASYEAAIISRYSDYCKNLSAISFIDTIKLAKFLIPNLENYKLDTLAHFFNVKIPPNRHRALPDVIITVNIFLCLLIMLNGKIHSVQELLKIAGLVNKQPSVNNKYKQISIFDN